MTMGDDFEENDRSLIRWKYSLLWEKKEEIQETF